MANASFILVTGFLITGSVSQPVNSYSTQTAYMLRQNLIKPHHMKIDKPMVFMKKQQKTSSCNCLFCLGSLFQKNGFIDPQLHLEIQLREESRNRQFNYMCQLSLLSDYIFHSFLLSQYYSQFKFPFLKQLLFSPCSVYWFIMNLGRNQLLAWVNEALQCEYSNIEMLADGVAYCQLLDALHPNSLNFTRLNLNARYPDDCLRNLRILESGLKKLRINQPASFEKISQGKFQDNINFLQWLYAYTMKKGPQHLECYDPYSKRIQIMQRQNKDAQQMSSHLIPAHAYMSYQQQLSHSHQQYEQQDQPIADDQESQLGQKKEELVYRIRQIRQDTTSMEVEMKTQMETNWRLMHNIQRSIEERNTLFLLLKQIQTLIKQADNSSLGSGILAVIQQLPQDFAQFHK